MCARRARFRPPFALDSIQTTVRVDEPLEPASESQVSRAEHRRWVVAGPSREAANSPR